MILNMINFTINKIPTYHTKDKIDTSIKNLPSEFSKEKLANWLATKMYPNCKETQILTKDSFEKQDEKNLLMKTKIGINKGH